MSEEHLRPIGRLRADVSARSAVSDLNAIREQLVSEHPSDYDVAPYDRLVADSFADRRFVMRVLSAFAMAAVLLTAVGLYGVTAYTASQRTGEVGLRAALGARRADILRVLLGAGARSVGLGVMLGMLGATALTRSLDSMLFGVGPLDPLSLGGAACILLLSRSRRT